MNKQQTFRFSLPARSLLLLATLFLYGPTLDAQVAKFQKTYSSANDPAGGYCVQQTSDGGYIAAGWSDNSIGSTYHDALLVKTTAGGVIQWTFDYDFSNYTPSQDEFRYVIEVDDRIGGVFDGIPDAYVVVGWTQGLFEGPTFGLGDKDILAAKVDLNGNVLWARKIGDIVNDYHEEAFCVKQNPVTGNYVLTGTGECQVSGGVESRLLLIELDARTGAINWDHAYGLPNATIGGPYTGGYSLSTYDRTGSGTPQGWIVCGWTTDDSDPNNRSEEDLYLVATDWNGNPYPSSLKRYGVSTGPLENVTWERGYSVQQRANGDVVVAGEYQPPAATSGPMLLSVSRNLAAVNFMRHYDAFNFDFSAAHSFRESTPVNGVPGFVFAVGGSGNLFPDPANDPTPQSDDPIMFHTDLTGLTVDWAWRYADPAAGYIPGAGGGYSVRATSDGYVMTGIDHSYNGIGALPLVKTDLWGSSRCNEEQVEIEVETVSPYILNHGSRLDLALGSASTVHSKTSRANEEVHCYSIFKPIPAPAPGEESGSQNLLSRPNPVRSGQDLSLSFDLTEEGPATITVTDLLGKIIYTQTATWTAGTVELRVPTTDWEAGTYTATLHPEAGVSSTRKVLVTD